MSYLKYKVFGETCLFLLLSLSIRVRTSVRVTKWRINGHENESQRLLTVIMIGGYTKNQKINLVPKLIGEFLKRNNCSKRGLELLQRCGVTLLSKSVSRDQDKIGEHFLSDVKKRKEEIQVWHGQRKTLEKLVSQDYGNSTKVNDRLKLQFFPDEFCPQMYDLGEHLQLLNYSRL